MQEQNFEKQVQKKLEELNLSPSAPVWKRVEEQIRKKKDRRRIFLWLIPFTFLCGGIYFYSDSRKLVEKNNSSSVAKTLQEKNSHKNEVIANNSSINLNKQSPGNKSISPSLTKSEFSKKEIFAGPSVQKERVKYYVTANSSSNKEEDTTEVNDNTINDTPVIVDKKLKETAQIKEEMQLANTEGKGNVNEKIPGSRKTEAQDNKQIVESNTRKPEENGSINNNTIDTVTNTISPSEPTKDTASVAIINEINTIQKPQQKLQIKKRWKLSASFAGGSSGIATSTFGKLSRGGAQSLDALRFYTTSAFTPNNFNNGLVVTTYYPSEIKNGFSFLAGGELERQLSNRLQLVTGLSYHFYSTSVSVGKKISQAGTINRPDNSVRVEAFYAVSNPSQTHQYKNAYHFIELPLGIKWQMIKNIPLQLEGGFRIGQLITTNALHYDNQQSIYYEDEELFKRTQFSFYNGLSYRILKLKKADLYIGPKAQFQLSNLLPKSNYGKQHLYFIGMETRISF